MRGETAWFAGVPWGLVDHGRIWICRRTYYALIGWMVGLRLVLKLSFCVFYILILLQCEYNVVLEILR